MAISTTQGPSPLNTQTNWHIVSVDSDWDDESGQVEVQVETRVEIHADPQTYLVASLNGISYQVNILAALP